jgi:hypothetical protein
MKAPLSIVLLWLVAACDRRDSAPDASPTTRAQKLDVCSLLPSAKVSAEVFGGSPVKVSAIGDSCKYENGSRRLVLVVGDYQGRRSFESDKAGRLQGAHETKVDGLEEAYAAYGPRVSEVFAYRGTTMVSVGLYNESPVGKPLGALVKVALDAFDERRSSKP